MRAAASPSPAACRWRDRRDAPDHRLAVLRQERTVGHVHQLQQLGIVADLQGNREYVLRAAEDHVHGKGGSRRLVNCGGSKLMMAAPVVPGWQAAAPAACGAGGEAESWPRRAPGAGVALAGAAAGLRGTRCRTAVRPVGSRSCDAVRWRSPCPRPAPFVQLAQLLGANDVRYQSEHDLVLMLLRVLRWQTGSAESESARAGEPLTLFSTSWSSRMPPSRLTSPSFSRISCSILRCPITGWLDAADIDCEDHRRNFDGHLQGDLAVGVHRAA